MDVEMMKRNMRLYADDTPIFVKPWGESEFHAIRFVEAHYDKAGKPFVLIIPEDDISGEVE